MIPSAEPEAEALAEAEPTLEVEPTLERVEPAAPSVGVAEAGAERTPGPHGSNLCDALFEVADAS